MTADNSPGRARVEGVDLFRGLVVVAMFSVHAWRIEVAAVRHNPTPGLAEASLRAMLWAEPFIAASFLFLAGVSLVLVRRRREGKDWVRWLGVRAAVLYILAVALFVLQYGVQHPDVWASPGILSAIALALLCGGTIVGRRNTSGLAAIFSAVIAGITAALDRFGLDISGINAGPGGAFPLVAMTLAGVISAQALSDDRANRIWLTALLAAFIVAVGIGSMWTRTHYSIYRIYSGLPALSLLSDGGSDRFETVGFWNHTATGFLGLLLPMHATLLVLRRFGPTMARRTALIPVSALGRDALTVYVAHLLLLGLLDAAGLHPKSATQTWLLIAGLVIATLSIARLKTNLSSRLRRARRKT